MINVNLRVQSEHDTNVMSTGTPVWILTFLVIRKSHTIHMEYT